MEQKETMYCEKHGILEAETKGTKMVYYASYPSYGRDKGVTYKVTVDLEKGEEEKREELSRYYKKGEVNMYL